MQASNVSMIEQRAKELDEARRIRMLKSEEIDVEKYLHNNDITQRVRVADEFLKELLEEIENPKIESICSMPWQKTITSFNFRPGEVTLYAGGNGGGKSLITGQIALGLIKQNQRAPSPADRETPGPRTASAPAGSRCCRERSRFPDC